MNLTDEQVLERADILRMMEEVRQVSVSPYVNDADDVIASIAERK